MNNKPITKTALIEDCTFEALEYLEYIQQTLKDGGKIYDKINTIEYDSKSKNYEIMLEKKIFDFDRVYFKIKDTILQIDKDVEILKYNQDTNIMIISIKNFTFCNKCILTIF